MDVITFPRKGLSILLHGIISLPDAMSYDKMYIHICKKFYNATATKILSQTQRKQGPYENGHLTDLHFQRSPQSISSHSHSPRSTASRERKMECWNVS